MCHTAASDIQEHIWSRWEERERVREMGRREGEGEGEREGRRIEEEV